MKKLLSFALAFTLVLSLLTFTACQSAPEKHVLNPDTREGFGDGDHADSRYYKVLDFYNMKSDDTLTIISNFETYQQTTSFSCGLASTLMVLNYYGEDVKTVWTEENIIRDTGAKSGGVNQNPIVDFFKRNYPTWHVEYNERQNAKWFLDYSEFVFWLKLELQAGHPVIADWRISSGHWEVIIGLDECDPNITTDDVLIFADPSDNTDHYQDGYMVFPGTRFFSMWKESSASDLSTTNGELGVQQFVLAYPVK